MSHPRFGTPLSQPKTKPTPGLQVTKHSIESTQNFWTKQARRSPWKSITSAWRRQKKSQAGSTFARHRFRARPIPPTLVYASERTTKDSEAFEFMDTLTIQERSEIMSRVRSKNTRPEVRVRSVFHRMGYRFRLHPKLPGRPDFVLPRHGVVVFVHGCFWHRHRGCPNTRTPKSRIDFWKVKFDGNVKRDKAARKLLRSQGWRVMILWECEKEIERKIRKFMGGR